MSKEQHLKISCFILRLFLQEILKDGRIDASEKEGFQTLVQKLGIPAELAKKEFDSVKAKMIANPDQGAIDYVAFFTEVHDNLQKVIPAPDGVRKILNQVAVLLKAETELASFLSSEAPVEAPPVVPVAPPIVAPVKASSVEPVAPPIVAPVKALSVDPAVPSTAVPESGLIVEGQTRELGDGIYDITRDMIHNSFEINDKDITDAGFFKGGE